MHDLTGILPVTLTVVIQTTKASADAIIGHQQADTSLSKFMENTFYKSSLQHHLTKAVEIVERKPVFQLNGGCSTGRL